ncbi:MAG: RMD1 family protein [Bacteroidales bacterium]|nr:RMD1 family protein [Bacteroidales bacterium]
MKILAYQISEQIDLKKFVLSRYGETILNDTNDYFYKNEKDQYLYVFKYGVACFLGYQESEIERLIEEINRFSTKEVEREIQEEYHIRVKPDAFEVGFHQITIGEADPASFKLIMLNISQSVALNHYFNQTAKLLEDIQNYTLQLEKYGKFKISWRKLKMFIGRALNIKNRISDNLFIFDVPQIAWDNEYLHQIDQGMKKEFNLQGRTRNIQDDITIITDNLELFTNITLHRKDAFLEWIIILLILIEVLNLLFEKLL